jgi:hypothetical protein
VTEPAVLERTLPARLETLEEALDYIQNIDLSLQWRHLVNPRWGTPVPEHVADKAVRDYRRFLFLMRKYEVSLAPTLDIDLVWHEHILDTIPYTRDTAAVFGRYVHHAPSREEGGKRSPELQNLLARTCELYLQEYGEKLQTYFGHAHAHDEPGQAAH